MSDMIERVARALCRDYGDDPDQRCVGGLIDGPRWYLWRGKARCAIEAMRVPTDEMNDAPYHSGAITGLLPHDAENVWRAMIDAALSSPDRL